MFDLVTALSCPYSEWDRIANLKLVNGDYSIWLKDKGLIRVKVEDCPIVPKEGMMVVFFREDENRPIYRLIIEGFTVWDYGSESGFLKKKRLI